ncbi:MAG TPA: ComEA family DNA-binding protein [Methylophilaceae bacterium]|nr:ComEA family DNA-binding protein [Methylophilaceae bacterium]
MKQLLLSVMLVASISLSIFGSNAYAAVDLNTATATELQGVKGIGPKKAEAIIEYRKKNGQFTSVGDLDKVPGFGKSTVEKMKNEITVGNAQAAAAGKPAKSKASK